MKRRMDQRLYLLVRREPLLGEPGTTPPDGAADGGAAREAGSSDVVWQFPAVLVAGDETLRSASERALTEVVGRRHAVYHVGNAPMAHLPGSSSGADAFYMLAQVRALLSWVGTVFQRETGERSMSTLCVRSARIFAKGLRGVLKDSQTLPSLRIVRRDPNDEHEPGERCVGLQRP
eukprot:365270-Chlamydomonas_euryale.AAC.17